MLKFFTYLNAYVTLLTDRRGSPTVEYVILIGVGASVAGLLALALNSDNNSGIVDVIAKKISAIINQATTPTGGNTPTEHKLWNW